MRTQVRSLASLSRLRIQHCHGLWCRSQTWLRSGIVVAVAVASSYGSNLTPSPGTSICCRCSPKKRQKNKQNKTKQKTSRELEIEVYLFHTIKSMSSQTHSQHQNSEIQDPFSSNTGTRQKISSVLLFNIVLKILANTIREKYNKWQMNNNYL